MLHPSVVLWILRNLHRRLVIQPESRRYGRCETDSCIEILVKNNLLSSGAGSDIFGFGRRRSDDGLQLARPVDSTDADLDYHSSQHRLYPSVAERLLLATPILSCFPQSRRECTLCRVRSRRESVRQCNSRFGGSAIRIIPKALETWPASPIDVITDCLQVKRQNAYLEDFLQTLRR